MCCIVAQVSWCEGRCCMPLKHKNAPYLRVQGQAKLGGWRNFAHAVGRHAVVRGPLAHKPPIFDCKSPEFISWQILWWFATILELHGSRSKTCGRCCRQSITCRYKWLIQQQFHWAARWMLYYNSFDRLHPSRVGLYSEMLPPHVTFWWGLTSMSRNWTRQLLNLILNLVKCSIGSGWIRYNRYNWIIFEACWLIASLRWGFSKHVKNPGWFSWQVCRGTGQLPWAAPCRLHRGKRVWQC